MFRDDGKFWNSQNLDSQTYTETQTLSWSNLNCRIENGRLFQTSLLNPQPLFETRRLSSTPDPDFKHIVKHKPDSIMHIGTQIPGLRPEFESLNLISNPTPYSWNRTQGLKPYFHTKCLSLSSSGGRRRKRGAKPVKLKSYSSSSVIQVDASQRRQNRLAAATGGKSIVVITLAKSIGTLSDFPWTSKSWCR